MSAATPLPPQGAAKADVTYAPIPLNEKADGAYITSAKEKVNATLESHSWEKAGREMSADLGVPRSIEFRG